MKIILATFGSFGDIYPFLSIGKILKDAGHDVALISNPFFRDRVIQHGIGFHPAGSAEDYKIVTAPVSFSANPFRAKKEKIAASVRLLEYIFMKPVMETYNAVSSLSANGAFVFYHNFAYGARLACEKHGIRGLAVSLSPYWLNEFAKPENARAAALRRKARFLSSFVDARVFLEPFNIIRARVGLPPLEQTGSAWMFREGSVSLFPEWLAPYRLEDGMQHVFLGFPGYAGAGRHLSDNVSKFLKNNNSPVVFTPGTSAHDTQRFFRAVTEALDILKLPGIFLSNDRPAKELPGHIICSDFEPLEALLPGCPLLVHHGSIGTMSAALRAGIPQIIAFQGGERRDNARAVQRLGAGTALGWSGVSGRKLARHIQKLTASADVKARLSDISAKVSGNDFAEKLLGVLKE